MRGGTLHQRPEPHPFPFVLAEAPVRRGCNVFPNSNRRMMESPVYARFVDENGFYEGRRRSIFRAYL